MGRRDDGGEDPVEVGEGKATHETELAILVKLEDGHNYWIPKSVIHEDSELYGMEDGENEGQLVVKQWWYDGNGLVPEKDENRAKVLGMRKQAIRWG